MTGASMVMAGTATAVGRERGSGAGAPWDVPFDRGAAFGAGALFGAGAGFGAGADFAVGADFGS